MHAAPGRAVQHAARVKSVVSTSNNVYNMQVLEVPLMVNPSQDEGTGNSNDGSKGIRQKRDTTTGLLFSNLTSLRMNELTGESAASIVLALVPLPKGNCFS